MLMVLPALLGLRLYCVLIDYLLLAVRATLDLRAQLCSNRSFISGHLNHFSILSHSSQSVTHPSSPTHSPWSIAMVMSFTASCTVESKREETV